MTSRKTKLSPSVAAAVAQRADMKKRMKRLAKGAINPDWIKDSADIPAAMRLLALRGEELKRLEVAQNYAPKPGDKLRLYEWSFDVKTVFALAYSADHARALVMLREGSNMEQELRADPVSYETPTAFTIYNGE